MYIVHFLPPTTAAQVVLNGPKVEVAAAAAAAAAAAQQQVVVPQTTDMTPVAIDTALTALQLPGQLQAAGRQQGAKTKQQTPAAGAAGVQTTSCQQLSVVVSSPSNQSSPQTALSGSTQIAVAPTAAISPPRTTNAPIVTVTAGTRLADVKSPHDSQSLQSTASNQHLLQASCSGATQVIATGPQGPSPTKSVVVVQQAPPASATSAGHCQPSTTVKSSVTISAGGASTSGGTSSGGQLKTPNFRAVLDRFDRLCGVSLTPPSLADRPVRLEVSGGSGSLGAMTMPKLANVQIRNPKKLPAATPLSPNLSPAGSSRTTPATVRSSFLPQLPADPTRGKISADLLRRLKEEVDNRWVQIRCTLVGGRGVYFWGVFVERNRCGSDVKSM